MPKYLTTVVRGHVGVLMASWRLGDAASARRTISARQLAGLLDEKLRRRWETAAECAAVLVAVVGGRRWGTAHIFLSPSCVGDGVQYGISVCCCCVSAASLLRGAAMAAAERCGLVRGELVVRGVGRQQIHAVHTIRTVRSIDCPPHCPTAVRNCPLPSNRLSGQCHSAWFMCRWL